MLNNQTCFGRSPLDHLAFALCVLLAAAVAEAREPVDDGLFVAKGLYRVFDGASFPATFYADAARELAWMEIEATPGQRSWALFDWSSGSPMGHIGNEHQCFSMTLELGGFVSPARFLETLPRDLAAEPQLELAQMPRGLNVFDRFIVLNDDEAVVVFEALELDRRLGTADAAPPRFDRGSCQLMRALLDRLTPVTDRGFDAASGVGGGAAKSASRLGRNYPYTFHGAGYHWLTYQGGVFEQTKAQYDAAVESCEADGPDTCKPYWVTGGLFGRYGRYCGDGWGTGRGAPVSSVDYCCSLHDGQSWDRSGDFGHEARNLCGFAACLTCKYYVSLSDWEVNFRGDFWASQPISAFVAAGIAAAWCHPQSWITGFLCS
ncbi:MAG: hypothetical protein AAGC60_02220 [Acidobacteriota bacterium]